MSAVVTMSRITRKHGLQRFDGRSNSEARAHADARPDYPRAQAKKPAAAFTLVSALQPVDPELRDDAHVRACLNCYINAARQSHSPARQRRFRTERPE